MAPESSTSTPAGTYPAAQLVAPAVHAHFAHHIQTAAEQGYNILSSTSRAISAPAGTPEAVVNRLAQSPYLKAIENKVTLAFIANQNLRNIKLGTPLYGCFWGLVWCHKVGTVKAVLDGEVQDIHPHDESIQRGLMLEIDVTDWGASETVLFAGAKPLWFL